MLEVSGGDAAALAEITATRQFIASTSRPDLAALLVLAVTRDQIARRNSATPQELPAVWATLGHPVRAEALARSIPDPTNQARAMAALAGALGGHGDPARTRRVASLAQTAASSVIDPYWQAVALAEIAAALAGFGDQASAEAIIRDSVTEPFCRAQALASVAQALARDDDAAGARRAAREAEAAAGRVADPGHQSWALADAAEALAAAGDPDGAASLARSIANPARQARALASLARVLAGQGQDVPARRAGGLPRHAAAADPAGAGGRDPRRGRSFRGLTYG
jgi:hypothetical protein